MNLPTWHEGVLDGLREVLHTPVVIENDVNLAAMAERADGAAAGLDDFAFVWLGGGLGLATVIGGTVLRGSGGAAGEIGWMPVHGTMLPAGDEHPGKAGLQALAGGWAVQALAAEHGFGGGAPDEAVARAVAAGARRGEAFIDEVAHRVSIGVAAICTVLDPGLVVLGGTVGRRAGRRWPREWRPGCHGSAWPSPRCAHRRPGEPVLRGAMHAALDQARAGLLGSLGDSVQSCRNELGVRVTYLEDEIFSQPVAWQTAIDRVAAGACAQALPRPGERVAVIGCGSSLNVARACARLREDAGHGLTDAYPASELTGARTYDRMVFISRTGTTSEVLAALREAPAGVSTTSITADPDAPLARETDHVVLLDFANERSVVSSQFITTAIVVVRAHLGQDLTALPAAAAAALARPLPGGERCRLTDREEFTFLGAGWAAFVADEAALKLREASSSWAESYPALEFRHGPISVSDDNTVVWGIGDIPESLAQDAARTGAQVVTADRDPLVCLTARSASRSRWPPARASTPTTPARCAAQ